MASKLSLTLRLAALPILIWFVIWTETRHFPDYFRLLSIIFVFLLLADVASLARGKLRDLLLMVASLTFGAAVVEGVAYFIEPKQMIVSTDGYTVRRPVIGWGPGRAGLFHSEKIDPNTGAIIYSVDYTIDDNLLRQTRSSDTDPTIAFFGDSMTFGLGVNDADTLPQAFADALDRKGRVLNLAFGGYGPQQFLRALETGLFDPIIGPQPKLFVFMTTPWHAERTACKVSWVLHAPRYVVETDEVRFKGTCYEGASLSLQEWLWNSASYRTFVAPLGSKLTGDDIETYIRILLAAVRLAKEKYGAETVIPFMAAAGNYLPGTGFDNDAIIARLREGGALVLDVSLKKEEAAGAKIQIEGDGHPTPLANRLRAAMLKDLIETHASSALVSSQERAP
ncbi:SGNH/GDSL hydrolase family protein [Methylocapsa polymorpha]|uniref:SGNH/GDSL hydrolase family protein n=1 Tax=Methylocapsa polymorpha TaxID=3080828 RepID=A0ABZ0HQ49_9HYPH|nr:SGNH/GDSL hydrolase family protein [Methylocapsa sp. RX1]